MKSNHAAHTILVPIVGEDISADTYLKARSLLEEPDSRLILLHIKPADEPATAALPASATGEPRWHRLACAIPTDRTFIDAVVGDPKAEILDEAARFHSDTILV